MAYKIVLTHNFESTASYTSNWIEKNWSYQSALKFQRRLLTAIESVSKNPGIGKPSAKRKNIRSVFVTRHNRIYYRWVGNTITILELFETKQSPRKNKYD